MKENLSNVWNTIAFSGLVIGVLAVVLAVALPGPQGEMGSQGQQGERGEQGLQGLEGLKGEQGDPGEVLVIPMTAGTGTVLVKVENIQTSSIMVDVYAPGELKVEDSTIASGNYGYYSVEVNLTFDCETVGIYAVHYGGWLGADYEDRLDINLCQGPHDLPIGSIYPYERHKPN